MFKAPFSFEGRIGKVEYQISAFLAVISINLIHFWAAKAQLGEILFIPLLWFIIAQGVKRCHDHGKEGWYQIIPFYFFTLLFSDGDKESNKYGTNSKADR